MRRTERQLTSPNNFNLFDLFYCKETNLCEYRNMKATTLKSVLSAACKRAGLRLTKDWAAELMPDMIKRCEEIKVRTRREAYETAVYDILHMPVSWADKTQPF